MFALCLVASVFVLIKVPTAHIVSSVKPCLIFGTLALTAFFGCDILSLYTDKTTETNAKIMMLSVTVYCILRFLNECRRIAKRRKNYK